MFRSYSVFAFIVLFLIGWVGLAGFVPPHSPMEGPEEIAQFYRADLMGIRLGMVLSIFTSAFLLPWDGSVCAQICAPTSAQLSVQQNGGSANLHQGSFAVVSTSLPFRARIRPESRSDFFSSVHVRMPGALIRRKVPHIDELCGREVPVRPGCNRMMLSLFELALTEGPHLSGAAKANVGRDLLDIFGHVAAALVEDAEPRGAKLSARGSLNPPDSSLPCT